MKVGQSTLQKQVHTKTEHLDFPDSQLAINEVSIDGGKVRLRTVTKGQEYTAEKYQIPPEFTEDIPGITVYQKYAKYLADL